MALSAPPLPTDVEDDVTPLPSTGEEPRPAVHTEPPSTPTPAPLEAAPGGHWRVWLLPTLLVVYIRFYYRFDNAQPPWIPTALFVAVLAVQLWLLRRRAEPPAAPAPARYGTVSVALFGLIVVLFGARALWHHDLFPAYLLGESGTTLSHADTFANVAPSDTHHFLKSYNLGLGPLFSLVPHEARTMEAAKRFTVAVYGLAVAGLMLLLHHASVRLRGERLAPLAVYVPLAVCALTLVSTRRYKWHAMAFFAGIAVYTILINIQEPTDGPRRRRVGMGLAVLAASVFLYHGTIVFVPILVVMLLAEAWIGPAEWRSERQALAKRLVAVLLVIVSFVLARRDFSGFYDRLTFEVNDPRPEQAVSLRLLRNWNNLVDAFFITDLSFPLSVAFVVGLAVSLAALRRSWLARLHVGVFAGVGLPLFYTYALTNPDETHFALAPILGLLAVGLAELTRPIASRLLPSLLVGIALAATETAHYDGRQLWRRMDAFPHPHDPAYRLTLALRDAQRLRRASPEPERLVFFLPSGFEGTEANHKYQHLLAQRDYADVRDSVRPYREPDDLLAALIPLVRQRHAARIRVYIDDAFDVGELTRRGASPAYAHSVIRTVPHQDVWRETIPLRFVDFIGVR